MSVEERSLEEEWEGLDGSWVGHDVVVCAQHEE